MSNTPWRKPPREATKEGTASTGPRKRRAVSWQARLLLVAFGLLLVLLVEGGLRLVGVGGQPPLVRTIAARGEANAREEVRETVQHYLGIFFRTPGPDGRVTSGSMTVERYFEPKLPNTFRVVVIGESTIQGFPMPRNLTAVAFLRESLAAGMPDKQVEVLNLGATAVASFVMRKMGEEALATMEPDLLIVYGAHNEFFGAGGVASSQRLGANVRAMEWAFQLRKSGFVTLMDHLSLRIAQWRAGDSPGDTSLIRRMAATNFVDPKGPLHEQARGTLEGNWEALRVAAFDRGVPVIFCTVASNEAGMAPMVSSTVGLDAAALRRVEELIARGTDLATAPTAAVAALEQAVAAAPAHAMAHYRLAEALNRAGSPEKAAEHYRQARDLDGLPWRAARDKNEVIRQVATRPGAFLADTERAFATHSGRTGGTTDWVLFDDHLHPSLRGQAILALTMYLTIRDGRLAPGLASDHPPLTFEQLTQVQVAHLYERLRVVSMMSSIFESPPLGLNNAHAHARFRAMVDTDLATALRDPIHADGVRQWRVACDEAGTSLGISYYLAAAYLRADQPAAGLTYARAARKNAVPLSDEASMARTMEVLAYAMNPEFPAERVRAEIVLALNEANFITVLPEQPSPLLSASLGVLHQLAGNAAAGAPYIQSLGDKSEIPNASRRLQFQQLPDGGTLAALAEKGRAAVAAREAQP